MYPARARLGYDDFIAMAPTVQGALRALGTAVDESGLEKSLTELVKLRASQINGCAFCVQFHLNLARKIGIAAEKLDLVAAWRDAGIFTDREAVALGWAEALTDMATHGAMDAAYEALLQHFSKSEAVFLTVTIGTVNQWNRIAVALGFAPPILKAAKAET